MKTFTLLPVYKTCRACNMELLPTLMENGTGSKIAVPDTYCDAVCEKLHVQYPRIFGQGNRERYFEKVESYFQ